MSYFEEGLKLSKEIGDRRSEGISLGNLASVNKILCKYDLAILHYNQCLEIATEIGDKRNQGIYHGNLGSLFRSLGNYEPAIEQFQQSLQISREIGNRRVKASVWEILVVFISLWDSMSWRFSSSNNR